MSNLYRMNKDYISSFQTKVYSRYNTDEKRTETGLLRAIFKEISDLFRKIGGQLSHKRNIPKAGTYPNSKKYNNLVQDICFDIDKLYNAQKLVETDVVNLVNFNSTQRDKIFESLVKIQQQIFSAYIKSKKDLLGGVEIPTGNPFTSADGMDSASNGVFIDEDRRSLTLSCDSKTLRIADSKNTSIYFIESIPTNIYPRGDTLGVGSHWKQPGEEAHFLDQTNASTTTTYKTMMSDDPALNTSVGYCEFEAVKTVGVKVVKKDEQVITRDRQFRFGAMVMPATVTASRVKYDYNFVYAAQKYIGQQLGLDPDLIKIDSYNSFQGDYITMNVSDVVVNPKLKLVIPFTASTLTNEIVVEFTVNEQIQLPKILWKESKVIGKTGDSSLVPSVDNNFVDGRCVCHSSTFVTPTRLELVFQYASAEVAWTRINFIMAHYKYTDFKPSTFLNTSGGHLSITIKRTYEIFVDAEVNVDKERARALNVLSHPNR